MPLGSELCRRVTAAVLFLLSALVPVLGPAPEAAACQEAGVAAGDPRCTAAGPTPLVPVAEPETVGGGAGGDGGVDGGAGTAQTNAPSGGGTEPTTTSPSIPATAPAESADGRDSSDPTASSSPTGSTDSTGSTGNTVVSADGGTTAAETHGWGLPSRVEGFDGPLGPEWNLYNGPGHAGNGRRSPDAVSMANGIMTITGDSSGKTEGMGWEPGAKYGRWEGRVKAPASDPSYNALLLLWPDAENFPVGGEVDFMEMLDHTRQETHLFLHYGANNSQVSGKVRIDATEWHNWAVEWAPTHIAAFVDGVEWWRTTNTSILPPGPMHLCIQLDWFPEGGSVQESYMHVDWVKYYPMDGSGTVTATGTEGGATVGRAGADVTTTDPRAGSGMTTVPGQNGTARPNTSGTTTGPTTTTPTTTTTTPPDGTPQTGGSTTTSSNAGAPAGAPAVVIDPPALVVDPPGLEVDPPAVVVNPPNVSLGGG